MEEKQPLDVLYTVKDVADAAKMSGKTIYKMCAAGTIPHMRLGADEDGKGGDIRFTQKQWAEFQEMNTVQHPHSNDVQDKGE